MNSWIIVAVCAVIVAAASFRGHHNGFLRTAFSMVALIVSIILVGVVSPYVSQVLNKTPMPKAIYNSVYHNMDKTFESFLEEQEIDGKAGEDTELTEEEQRNWMDTSHIPQWVQSQVMKTAEHTAGQLIDRVSRYVSDMLMNIICYVITLLVIYIGISLISMALGIVNYIPILGGINRTLGTGLGFVQGVFILWVLALVLTIFLPSQWGGALITSIENNPVLKVLYHFLISVGRS